jgi:RNA-dependent RNA polymerase
MIDWGYCCLQVEDVTKDLILDHFVNHAKNDNLGQISTWLLAQVDRKGAGCDECERLAQLHSTAVDFPKTGRPAVMLDEERKQLVRQVKGKEDGKVHFVYSVLVVI